VSVLYLPPDFRVEEVEPFTGVATSPQVMTIADTQHQLTEEDFRAEVLRWLPNVSRYARLLTRNQADAEDLTQETFLRAYVNWTTFRPGSDCRKWLFTICRNVFLRGQQRGARVVSVEDTDTDLQGTAQLYWDAAESGLANLFDRIDLGPAIERGVRSLPAEYREALILVDIEDCTYADAAAALGVPVGTVRSRVFRARRLLQQALVDHARDIGLDAPSVKRDGDKRILT
jgi:RNA polymerase sigma-70 factor (ECF subfamily)